MVGLDCHALHQTTFNAKRANSVTQPSCSILGDPTFKRALKADKTFCVGGHSSTGDRHLHRHRSSLHQGDQFNLCFRNALWQESIEKNKAILQRKLTACVPFERLEMESCHPTSMCGSTDNGRDQRRSPGSLLLLKLCVSLLPAGQEGHAQPPSSCLAAQQPP